MGCVSPPRAGVDGGDWAGPGGGVWDGPGGGVPVPPGGPDGGVGEGGGDGVPSGPCAKAMVEKTSTAIKTNTAKILFFIYGLLLGIDFLSRFVLAAAMKRQ